MVLSLKLGSWRDGALMLGGTGASGRRTCKPAFVPTDSGDIVDGSERSPEIRVDFWFDRIAHRSRLQTHTPGKGEKNLWAGTGAVPCLGVGQFFNEIS